MKNISLLYISNPVVIIQDDRGFNISNQTNGCCCSHPETKGYIIPLPLNHKGQLSLNKNKDLFDAGKNYLNFDLDKTKSDYEQVLKDNGFDEAKIIDGHEAWLSFTFYDKSLGWLNTGVLTWENSD